MSGREIEFDDVFSRTQRWGLRAFGAGAFLLPFGGIYALLRSFTLGELTVVTMLLSAFAGLFTMSVAVRLSPAEIEFDFEEGGSKVEWSFVNGFTHATMVWVFVFPVGIPFEIASLFVTLDVLLTSCMIGGTLLSMSVGWLFLDHETVTIQRTRSTSSSFSSGGSVRSSSGSDSVSLDDLQTDPVEVLSEQDEELPEQQIRSATADVRDSIENHEFSDAKSELDRLASEVQDFEEQDDIAVDDMKQELRSLQVEIEVEQAKSKIAKGRDALDVDQSNLASVKYMRGACQQRDIEVPEAHYNQLEARKRAEEARNLLEKARQFAETHRLDKTDQVDDIQAEAELLSKQAGATEQSHEKESSERESDSGQITEEIRSSLADVRKFLKRGNITNAEYKLDKARDAFDSASGDASTTDDVTALREEAASLRVEIRLEKAQKKVAEADRALERGEIDTAQEKTSKGRNMLESARQFAVEKELDFDDRFADIEEELEPIEARADPTSKATEYLNKAKAALESGDHETAKKSLQWFDDRIDESGIPADIESDASELRKQIAAIEEVETLVSEANTARQQAKYRFDADQFGEACERANVGLKNCQQAEQSEYVDQINTPLSIEGIRSDLEVILEKSEPVVERIEEAKGHRDAARSAIESDSYEEAERALEELESALGALSEHDNQRIEQLRSDARQLEDRLETVRVKPQVDEIRNAVDDLVVEAQSALEDGSLEKAHEELVAAREVLREATASSEARALDRERDIGARLGQIETVADLVEQADSQVASARRALQSQSFDTAESTISKLDNTVERLADHDALDPDPSELRGTVERLESEIEIGRAEDRLNGLIGAVESARSQAEELLDDGDYERAITRLESALDTLDDAVAVNDQHELGYGNQLSERRDRIESLLEDVSTDAKERHAEYVAKAEKAVARGIDCRSADDPAGAVEAFEEAHDFYSDAMELASDRDLPELWETEQRHSMVSEYLEVAREELDERRRTTQEELEQALDRADTAIVRAEQYAEVDDHVSVRETLADVVSHLDDATQLLNIEGVTTELRSHYDDLADRADALHKTLPDEEETGEYRNQDLVESLQGLATKLGESPRPEFVNKYGEYPADAYLEAFGSWPEALASANLDSVDENARERRTYSRVDVLDELVSVADEFGHPPSKSEMNEHGSMSSTTVENRFQDWKTALEIANVTGSEKPESSEAETETDVEKESEEPTTTQSSILDQNMLAIIRDLHTRLGRIPKPTELPGKCEYSPNDFYQKFGSWDEALEAAGIDKEQAMLDEIKRVADKLGRVPNTTDMDKHGTYSGSNYVTYFGSWSTALEQVHIEENREAELLETLQSLHDRLDRLPKTTDLHDMSGVSQHDYIRKFGSWDEALEAAGIDKEEVLIDNLQQVATEVDGTPGTTAVNQHGTYSAPMYQKYFGSWDAALEAAGLLTTDTETGEKQETEEVATDTVTLPPSTPIDDIKHRVDGVGSSAIRAVKQAGYTTLDDLHGAQPEDITTYKGIGRTKALKLIRFATEHVSSSDTTTRPSADHHPRAEGSQTSPSNASAEIQPGALETSWETIPSNERIDGQFLVQVTDVDRRAGNRKSAQLNVQDKNGREFKMNIWSKHDVDRKFTKDRWYALENARGEVWESSDGATQKKLSSTKDLNVVELGADFDPNAASIGGTSKVASEPQQPEVTTNEDVSKSTSESTSPHQDTAATANEADSSGDDSPEVDDDGILGDIMSDFDVS